MKWTVAQLQKYRNNPLEIDQSVNITKSLSTRDPEIRDATPIHVRGVVDVDTQKATFHLHLTGTLILPCARTLVDTEYPIDIQTTESFMLTAQEFPEAEDEDLNVPEDGVVNLLDVIEDIILVEIPIQVFSEKALEEDEMQKGRDWVVMTEEEFDREQLQKEPKVDPRLAGLAELLKDKDDKK